MDMELHGKEISITPKILKLIAEIDEFKGSWLSLGQLVPDRLTSLKKIATVKKNTNVLMHIMGYFKNNLTADEKKEMLDTIDSYHREFVPLIVPITLLNHYVRKYGQQYLKDQIYLNPHPMELMLRNHV